MGLTSKKLEKPVDLTVEKGEFLSSDVMQLKEGIKDTLKQPIMGCQGFSSKLYHFYQFEAKI